MQQSSQMLNGGAPSVPLTNITTEQIQKYLDENRQLIMAILEFQNQGKFTESASYQARLQQNLTYLAKLADAQQQTVPPQMPPQSVVVQQHPSQPAMAQQQQQQQFMLSQMGMKPGETSSIHQTMQFGEGIRQDGIGSGARGDTETYG